MGACFNDRTGHGGRRNVVVARRRPWLFACLCLAAGPATAIDIDVEAGYQYDSNIALGPSTTDELSDNIWILGVSTDLRQPLGSRARLGYRLQARGEVYNEYTGLSHVFGAAGISLQYRDSGRLRTPTFAAFARVAIDEFDSEMRDSTLFTLGASFQQHITDRLSYSAILSGTLRDSDSEVFDNGEGSLLLHVDQRLVRNWSAYLTLNFLFGQFVSTGAPTLTIVNAAEAIQPDDALGGVAANRFAYRLTGIRYVATLGTNVAAYKQHALDLAIRYTYAQADDDLSYQRVQCFLSYLVRF